MSAAVKRRKIAFVRGSLTLSRRQALAAALLALAPRAAAAQQGDERRAALESYALVAEDGDLVWYESSRRDQLDAIALAFAQLFPRLRVRGESIAGGVGIVGRVRQEHQVGGRMVDVVTLGGGGVAQLAARGLLRDIEWGRLPIDPMMVVGRHAVMTAASVYCLICNTDQIGEADTPRSWDALLEPRWRGRIGTWVRAAAFAELASVWGAERTLHFYRRFLDQNPMLFRSTAPLAQQVAAGECALGLGIHHTALAAQRRGAPIRIVILDPTPISAIYSAVVADTRRPHAAALFAAWLATPEGALVYERATDRGNPMIAETQAARLLRHHQLAEWPMDRKADYARLFELYNSMVNDADAR
ncbi:MAG: extracellular solute-binding protein [Alphaproteobacteria bacterium]|nr:extracellular solute-binding protein [Alphaproteobacteria bacterium]